MTPLSHCDAISVLADCTQIETLRKIAEEHHQSLEEFEGTLSRPRKILTTVFSASGLSGLASGGCYYWGAGFQLTATLGCTGAIVGILSLCMFYRAVYFIREATNEQIHANSLARRSLIPRSFRID